MFKNVSVIDNNSMKFFGTDVWIGTAGFRVPQGFQIWRLITYFVVLCLFEPKPSKIIKILHLNMAKKTVQTRLRLRFCGCLKLIEFISVPVFFSDYFSLKKDFYRSKN